MFLGIHKGPFRKKIKKIELTLKIVVTIKYKKINKKNNFTNGWPNSNSKTGNKNINQNTYKL